MKKILLVDANLLMFRSFYAAQAISKTPSNMPTHLFFTSLLEMIKEQKPNNVFLAFDAHAKTKRHEEFEDYKAGRIKPPEELYKQKEIINEILDVMKLTWFSIPGDEADDIIATICEKFKNNNEILIMSEDRDLFQLIDLNVSMIIKNKNKDVKAKYEKISVDNFYSKFNYLPNQVTDYKGIAGDSSDNLIGVKGIGPKTAIDLLSKYKSLEGIYENLDKLSEKQKNAFITNKDNSFMCKKLATLNRFVELNITLENGLIVSENFNNNDVNNVLEKYNLKRVMDLVKTL